MYRKDNKLQTKYEWVWIIYMNNETNKLWEINMDTLEVWNQELK
jgi:hypothetical protein